MSIGDRGKVEPLSLPIERDRVDTGTDGKQTEHTHLATLDHRDVGLGLDRRMPFEETPAGLLLHVVDHQRRPLRKDAGVGDVDHPARRIDLEVVEMGPRSRTLAWKVEAVHQFVRPKGALAGRTPDIDSLRVQDQDVRGSIGESRAQGVKAEGIVGGDQDRRLGAGAAKRL